MKIILVDDHVLFREGLVSVLKSQPDFEIVGQAGKVSEAILLARQVNPDVILMDFSLPDGTGVDATQAILAENPKIKIVFLTIHEDDLSLLAAIRKGAKGYLLKNLTVSSLISSLRALEQGEAAVSRIMVNRLLEELAKGQSTPADTFHMPDADLTSREIEIVKQIAKNASNSEIARQLVISENTVKNHVHNILSKLKLDNRRQAVDYARRVGLVTPVEKNH
jgi:DNA-binding NarL/FixJ family response regulator